MNTDSPLYPPMVVLTVVIVVVALAAVIRAYVYWRLSDRYSEQTARAEEVQPFDDVAATELRFQAFQAGRRARSLASIGAVALIILGFAWALPAMMSAMVLP